MQRPFDLTRILTGQGSSHNNLNGREMWELETRGSISKICKVGKVKYEAGKRITRRALQESTTMNCETRMMDASCLLLYVSSDRPRANLPRLITSDIHDVFQVRIGFPVSQLHLHGAYGDQWVKCRKAHRNSSLGSSARLSDS